MRPGCFIVLQELSSRSDYAFDDLPKTIAEPSPIVGVLPNPEFVLIKQPF
jgi:hypothetical protein